MPVRRLKVVKMDLRATLEANFHKKFPEKEIATQERARHRRASKIIKENVKHTISEIGGVMTRGVGGIYGSSVRAVRFTYLDGGPGIHRKHLWLALTDRYRDKAPQSRLFWRKHFTGKPSYGGNRLLVDYTNTTKGRESVQLQKMVVKRATTLARRRVTPSAPLLRVPTPSKNLKTYSSDVTITGMPPPLDDYIIRSMVLEREVDRAFEDRSGKAWKGIRRIQYVEETRPFIAGVSAKLGRRMFQQLRRI